MLVGFRSERKKKEKTCEIVDHLSNFSPTSDGSGAAVLVSEQFLRSHPQAEKTAVEILAIEMATDLPSTFESNDCMKLVPIFRFVFRTNKKKCFVSFQVGYDMSKRAAQQAYAKSGVKPTDVQVVELHGKTFVLCFLRSITFENELQREKFVLSRLLKMIREFSCQNLSLSLRLFFG